MGQYMLLLSGPPGSDRRWSPEEMQKVVQEYGAWAQSLGQQGRIAGGEKLTPDGGKLIRTNGDDVSVTDGPYAETKEVIGGFFVVNADSYDEAVEIAKTCPHMTYGTSTLVRQIHELGAD